MRIPAQLHANPMPVHLRLDVSSMGLYNLPDDPQAHHMNLPFRHLPFIQVITDTRRYPTSAVAEIYDCYNHFGDMADEGWKQMTKRRQTQITVCRLFAGSGYSDVGMIPAGFFGNDIVLGGLLDKFIVPALFRWNIWLTFHTFPQVKPFHLTAYLVCTHIHLLG